MTYLIHLGPESRAISFQGTLKAAKAFATRNAPDDPGRGLILIADSDGREICRRRRVDCYDGAWESAR